MSVVRPVGHEDRLSLIEHLDELRTRLIVCIGVFIAAFSICYWQNHWLLRRSTSRCSRRRTSTARSAARTRSRSRRASRSAAARRRRRRPRRCARRARRSAGSRSRARPEPARSARCCARRSAARERRARPQAVAAAAVPTNRGRQPITLGVTEPFVTTFTVAGVRGAAARRCRSSSGRRYAFVLPAFSPAERRVALPLMLMVPVLFMSGVAFGYFVALPRAINFLQNFNDQSFDILIRAADYYKFSVVLLVVIGLLFQIPVGVLAVTRLGVISARQLAQQPRLRDPRARGPRRRRDADAGPGDDADRDGAARGPLRAQRPPRPHLRTPCREARSSTSGTTTTILPYPESHAVRPSRPRTPPHGPGDLPEARHPHGWRPRAVRHRRQPRAAAWSTPSRATRARRAPTTRSTSASTRSRSASRPTRRTRRPGRSSPTCASSCAGTARTTTRPRRPTPPKGKAALRQAAAAWQRYLALEPGEARHDASPTRWSRRTAPPGCSSYPEAVKAIEFVIDARRSATYQRTRSSPCSPTARSRRARRCSPPTRPLELAPRPRRRRFATRSRWPRAARRRSARRRASRAAQ